MKRVVERVDALIPAQPKALRVCAYARVSTGKDAMLHSLSAQVSYYSKMIQSHNGWMYCGVYSDEAVTGTKRERAGFQHKLHGKPRQKPSELSCSRCRSWTPSTSLTKNSG